MERKACFHKGEPSVIVCGLFTCQALVSCGFKVISAPKLLHNGNVCTVARQARHTWRERAQHSTTSETLMFIHILCTNNRFMCSDVHISLLRKTCSLICYIRVCSSQLQIGNSAKIKLYFDNKMCVISIFN